MGVEIDTYAKDPKCSKYMSYHKILQLDFGTIEVQGFLFHLLHGGQQLVGDVKSVYFFVSSQKFRIIVAIIIVNSK